MSEDQLRQRVITYRSAHSSRCLLLALFDSRWVALIDDGALLVDVIEWIVAGVDLGAGAIGAESEAGAG